MNHSPRRISDALTGILACPHCHDALSLDPSASRLTCTRHGEFPVIDGIPSFARGYDHAFETHWDDNASPSIARAKVAEARAFLEPLLRDAQSKGVVVLDAGCGEGAHVAALSERTDGLLALGVALDIAMSGVRDARRHAVATWCGVHADMTQLPFADASFDAVYSFGVLHLTPTPRQSLQELARVLKPGGRCGLWVFDSGPWLRIALQTLRWLARAAGPSGARVIADLVVPFYGLLPTRSGLTVTNSSWRQTREVLMSNLTPPYMHFLTRETLARWCAEAGLDVLPEPDTRPLTMWARKRAAT